MCLCVFDFRFSNMSQAYVIKAFLIELHATPNMKLLRHANLFFGVSFNTTLLLHLICLTSGIMFCCNMLSFRFIHILFPDKKWDRFKFRRDWVLLSKGVQEILLRNKTRTPRNDTKVEKAAKRQLEDQ